MPVKQLKEFLYQNQVKYVSVSHSVAYTAQEIAASAHVKGKELAKTVMVKVDGKSQPLGLTKLDTNVRIYGYLAETTTTMTFLNSLDRVMEGIRLEGVSFRIGDFAMEDVSLDDIATFLGRDPRTKELRFARDAALVGPFSFLHQASALSWAPGQARSFDVVQHDLRDPGPLPRRGGTEVGQPPVVALHVHAHHGRGQHQEVGLPAGVQAARRPSGPMNQSVRSRRNHCSMPASRQRSRKLVQQPIATC